MKHLNNSKLSKYELVGGFNPFEKYYIVKLGIFPQIGVKITKTTW